jgi:Fe-S cluster assembly protein SufD
VSKITSSSSSNITSSIPPISDENYRYISLRDLAWADLPVRTLQGEKKDQIKVMSRLSTSSLKEDFFVQLNQAQAEKVLLINLKGNQKYRLSAELLSESKALQCEHVVIRVEKNAQCELFHDLISPIQNISAHQNLLVDIELQEGAALNYFLLQDLSPQTFYAIRHLVSLSKDSNCEFRVYHQGAKKGQHRVETLVLGAGAQFNLEAAQKATGENQQMDFWVKTLHSTHDSQSQTTVWNVVDKNSVAVFNGNIEITIEGLRTQAYQSNKNLLLSSTAQVHTLPKLEIATDDVKCSHGASVSSLDPNQIFYLESRGISREQSEKMLIQAYTYPLVSKIPDAEIRKRYLSQIEEDTEEKTEE